MDDFISKDNKIAIIGVSQKSGKYGSKMYISLKEFGYKVFGVNPKYDELWGNKIYHVVADIPEQVDVAVMVVPPKVTEKVIEEIKAAGIKKVWMQPGSESDKAIKYCEDNDIECIHHACFVVDGLKDDFVTFEHESGEVKG
ncbi:MAG: CoA-binding protein [Candidatus Dojkabacteria bacterium]